LFILFLLLSCPDDRGLFILAGNIIFFNNRVETIRDKMGRFQIKFRRSDSGGKASLRFRFETT